MDFKSLRTQSSLAVIITAAVLVEITSGIQYYFAKEGIRQEVEHRAESELRAKSLEIRNVMNVVEVAVENMAWAVEQRLAQPDSMWAVTQKLLADNEYIVGSAVAFEPYYYPRKGRQFSPYSYKHDSTVTSIQLGTDTYDYHTMEWYTAPMASGRGHWSEPYFDEGGGEMMMSTYSLPIRNSAGQIVAIFTADVSLEWLSEVVNARHIYPSSYNLLLSRSGQIIVCPEDSLVMNTDIDQATAGIADTTADYINRQMKAGNSGQATVTDEKGETNYVFYGPVDDVTGWSMAVVCADKEIYKGLRGTRLSVFILMLVGMCLLGFIIWRTARGARRLQEINAQKASLERDLQVASGIQMGMLPKEFPSGHERDDVQIYATLTSAKEVGGDLFDFYFRDNKLFFCIGDVSGKGIPASLFMAVTRSVFRTVSAKESEPDVIMANLNNTIVDINESLMFVTMFIGVLDLPTGMLRYCNAGHDAPMLVGAGVGTLPCDANIPVGIDAAYRYTCQEALVYTGTTIFLYTDGLTEAENAEQQLFSLQRAKQTAEDALARQQHDPKKLISIMTDAVHTFVGDAEQSDDLTMMAIQYLRPNPESC
ncbi:MAG: SpoIIE family protein phosphatase [Paludibacteraceae bacterium]|nr:SpoIIE family protein phosphatase [Paludibacteraceae bacterium]